MKKQSQALNEHSPKNIRLMHVKSNFLHTISRQEGMETFTIVGLGLALLIGFTGAVASLV